MLRLTRPRGGNRHAQSLPGRRRGAQLRRQRQNAARRPVSNKIWIQPAAGDAGGALGAALAAYHQFKRTAAQAPTAGDGMTGALSRPGFCASRRSSDA